MVVRIDLSHCKLYVADPREQPVIHKHELVEPLRLALQTVKLQKKSGVPLPEKMSQRHWVVETFEANVTRARGERGLWG